MTNKEIDYMYMWWKIPLERRIPRKLKKKITNALKKNNNENIQTK